MSNLGEIDKLKKHLERNEGYFQCICVALEIDELSPLSNILSEIVRVKEQNKLDKKECYLVK